MPTKIFTKRESGSVGIAGKEYPIVDGAVDVPDEAVAVLVGSHGFTTSPESEEKSDKDEAPDLATFTKGQLIEAAVDVGAEVKSSMTKDEIYAIVKPLWDAKKAA